MERSRALRAWWISAAVAVGVDGALAVFVRVAPDNNIDRAIFELVSGWDVPLLDTTMERISWFTDLRPRLVLGFIAVIGIALSGRCRLAAVTVAVAAVAAIPVNGLDLAGGIVADRIRPNGAPFLAYPGPRQEKDHVWRSWVKGSAPSEPVTSRCLYWLCGQDPVLTSVP